MALLFLKGVRMGSPMRALAITLPEKMTSMDESHRDRGCFREKVNPAAKHTYVCRSFSWFSNMKNVGRNISWCSKLDKYYAWHWCELFTNLHAIDRSLFEPLTHSFRLRKSPLSISLFLLSRHFNASLLLYSRFERAWLSFYLYVSDLHLAHLVCTSEQEGLNDWSKMSTRRLCAQKLSFASHMWHVLRYLAILWSFAKVLNRLFINRYTVHPIQLLSKDWPDWPIKICRV